MAGMKVYKSWMFKVQLLLIDQQVEAHPTVNEAHTHVKKHHQSWERKPAAVRVWFSHLSLNINMRAADMLDL